jgi:serine protease inhibitor
MKFLINSNKACIFLLGVTWLSTLPLMSNPIPSPVASVPTPQSYGPLASAQAGFGLQFFQSVLKDNPNQNILISPYSASEALGMLYNGASGSTQKAMALVLGLGSMENLEINRENGVLQETFQNTDPSIQLVIANSLWGNNSFQFKPDFLQTNQTFYQAEIKTLDFSQPAASDVVNQWVSTQTRGKITKILGSLTPQDILVLVNAVYFKGVWTSEFKKDSTLPRPFHLSNGTVEDRPMMYQKNEFDYFETPKFQAVRLPYGRGNLSLMVFLPAKDSSLKDFCAGLTPENWNHWMDQWRRQEVVLSLPKFKIEFSENLKQPLTDLGMGIAFDKSQADFSAVSALNQRLYISQAIQKTYMLVDEEGTEAAAATAIVMRANIVMASPRPPKVMTVDRPFLMALVDQRTKSILFAGTVVDPVFPTQSP